MCGIAGFVGNIKNSPNKKNILNCKSSLIYRGPDNNDIYTEKVKNKKLIFLHSRLSIVDIDKGSNQPFHDQEGVLIFNGMIYNYLELRSELKKNGVRFVTNSDTEVLLKLLNFYSEKTLNKLEGMWSFAYFNKKTKILIMSRDRLGEKPFYYFNKNNNFYFSNSILSLRKIIGRNFNFNKKKINNLLTYPDKTYGLDNETVFNNIYQIPPGTYLKFKIERYNKIKPISFWKIKIGKKNIQYKKACHDLKKIIKDTVKKNVRSDVKNSVLVSGGLDSNTIVSNANKISKIKGYSLISTNPKYDERDKIKISEKFNNFKVKYISSNKKNSLKILEKIIIKSSNILLTPTSLGLALLCENIKKDGRRVLLTGIGGDELFCGYYINYLAHINSYSRKSKIFKKKHAFWKQNIFKFIRNPNLKNFKDSKKKNIRNRLHFFTEGNSVPYNYLKKNKKINIKNFSRDIFYNNMLQNIYLQSIPTQLMQTDIVSMCYDIESRSPFLSHKLFENVYKLKKDFFMHDGKPKSLLRDAMKNIFPNEIINNFEKTGFYSPFKSFFGKNDMKKIKVYLKKSRILNTHLNKKNFLKLIDKEDKLITHEESKFLFLCLNLSILEKKVFNK